MFNEITTRITPDSIKTIPPSSSAKTDSGKYYVTKDFVLEDNGKDVVTIQKNTKERKSKKLGLKIALSALGVGFAVLGLTKGLPKSFYKTLETKRIAASKKVAEMGHKGKQKWQGFLALAFFTKASKFVKGSFNFTSLKDALFGKFIEKSKILKRPAAWTTKTFEKFGLNTVANTYHKAAKKFTKLFTSFSDINAIKLENPTEAITINGVTKTAQEWLNEASKKLIRTEKLYSDSFSDVARNARLKDMGDSLTGLDKKVYEHFYGNRFKNTGAAIKDKNTYQSFFAEDLVATKKSANINKLNSMRDQILDDNINEILKIYEKVLPQKEFSTLSKGVKKATKSLNTAIDTEANKFFDKKRDLVIGSAPTDVLSILSALGMVGIGLGKADDRDERVSVTLKYGIPALGAIATSLYCAAGLVSGGAALAFGLLSGAIINKIGTEADEALKKAKQKIATELNKNHLPEKIPDSKV